MYARQTGIPGSKTRILYFSILVLLILALILFGSRIFAGSPSAVISPLADDPSGVKATGLFPQKTKNPEELITQLKSRINQEKGAYSIYIYDLKENKGYGINETTIFTAASVNKLPILAVLYYEAQSGKIDLDRRITIQARDIQDYGTGVIRYQGAGTAYSLKTLAQLMIEKSDNTAAYVLTSVIGSSRIQELIDGWGLTQTDIAENKTSNKDMSQLLVKMYSGQIANKAYTTEMIGFMDDTDFENRLPALLPDDVVVYHKIGTEVANIHDVGIVALPEHPYYLGVFTNDITDESATEAIIAQISKMTYDFMVGE